MIFLKQITLSLKGAMWYKNIILKFGNEVTKMAVYFDNDIMLSQAEIDKLIKKMEEEKEKNS